MTTAEEEEEEEEEEEGSLLDERWRVCTAWEEKGGVESIMRRALLTHDNEGSIDMLLLGSTDKMLKADLEYLLKISNALFLWSMKSRRWVHFAGEVRSLWEKVLLGEAGSRDLILLYIELYRAIQGLKPGGGVTIAVLRSMPQLAYHNNPYYM